MATELIINASLPETRIALMESGEIQDLLIERATGKGIVGNIYKGRVTRVLPGMQAAFVDIGLEKAAFLYVDDVYVHSELWEDEEEEPTSHSRALADVPSAEAEAETAAVAAEPGVVTVMGPEAVTETVGSEMELDEDYGDDAEDDEEDPAEDSEEDPEEDSDDEDDEPELMARPPRDQDGTGNSEENSGDLENTLSPPSEQPFEASKDSDENSQAASESLPEGSVPVAGEAPGSDEGARRRHRRGRRGGKFRSKRRPEGDAGPVKKIVPPTYPENYVNQVSETGDFESDRSTLSAEGAAATGAPGEESNRPAHNMSDTPRAEGEPAAPGARPEFRAQRGRDRRIRTRTSMRPPRPQVNIQDLLKEGQEVLVQVAKDPISTKGARLTCHISLPGRHLVCMPTIDHVGVSRRIERDDERRRLREYVERSRPKGLGFIVRTASGKQSEQRVKQDVEYLSHLWTEIKEKAATTTAPALVYEDLNSVLRAIRDWVTEEIDKIVVDSRYYFNDIQRFVSHFMPSLKQKVELYHGDIPIFDAYNISTELARGLERKVWLKSGGYIVVDQAEALVAIDVNTGRYVGKKNLEDTILKTNLEAVQEIAYQLRLRNCGGIIILDLIDMEKEENKQRVYRALEEALKRDRARPSILKISELGLVEMTRKRTRDTMVRALCESCPHCEGKGFIKSKTTVAYEVLREIERAGVERDISKVLVQAHSDVIDILAIDERESLDQLERRYHRQIYLQAVGDMHLEQFEVVSDKKGRAEIGKEENTRDSRDHRSGHSSSHGGGQDRSNRNGRNRQDRDRGRSSVVIGAGAGGGGGLPQPRGPIEPRLPVPNLVGASEISPPPLDAAEAAAISLGNSTGPHIVPVTPVRSGGPSGSPGSPGSPGSDDEFFDEEDRLAFLRAQAAQDAALAQLRSAGGAPGVANRPNGGVPRGDRGPGGGGGRNNNQRRGRRGGRFRKNERPRNFGPRDAAIGSGPSLGSGGLPAPISASPPSGGGSSGDDGGGNSGGGGETGGTE